MYLAVMTLVCLLIATAPSIASQNDYVKVYDRDSRSIIFIFKNDKGDVYFNHTKHQESVMRCLACHKTAIPTKEQTMTKLDLRKAHYFCKGCHKAQGRGPTACHECHKVKK